MKTGLLLFFIMIAFPCLAEEMVHASDESIVQRPQCSDKLFVDKIMETIETYQSQIKATSAKQMRQKLLRTKQIKNFEEISVADFEPKTDYDTANALIMVKINKQIDEKDIVLCKQTGKTKKPIYVLAYPYFDNFQGHIINLDPAIRDYEQISFIYP